MQLQLDSNSVIIGYADFGEISNGINFDEDKLPDDFYNKFKPSFYMFQDNKIIENPDYVEPSDTPPVSSPTSVQEAINKLGEVTAKIAGDDNQIKLALNKLGLAVADLQQTKEVK